MSGENTRQESSHLQAYLRLEYIDSHLPPCNTHTEWTTTISSLSKKQ